MAVCYLLVQGQIENYCRGEAERKSAQFLFVTQVIYLLATRDRKFNCNFIQRMGVNESRFDKQFTWVAKLRMLLRKF